MNYWDILPTELQNYILQLRGIKIIKNNWRKNPSIIAIDIANASKIRSGPYTSTINIEKSNITWALKYIIKHSNNNNLLFWIDYCYDLIASLSEITMYYLHYLDFWERDHLFNNKKYIYILVNKYINKVINNNYYNKILNNNQIIELANFNNLNNINSLNNTNSLYNILNILCHLSNIIQ